MENVQHSHSFLKTENHKHLMRKHFRTSLSLSPAVALAGLLAGNSGFAGDLAVDNLTVATNLSVGGLIQGNGSGLTNVQGAAIANGTIGTNQAVVGQWNDWGDNRYLKLSGGTVSGGLTANSNLIVNGTVGIGTTNPSSANYVMEIAVNKPIGFSNTGGGGGLNVFGPSSGASYIRYNYWDTYNTDFSFNSHGAYGINFQAQNTGNFTFYNNGSSTMILKNGGYVGVGTNAPAERLHVAGNIRAEGHFIGNGSGLYVLQQGDISMGSFTNGLPQ